MKYLGWIFRAFIAFYLMSYVLIAAHELGHLTFGLLCGLEYQAYSVGDGPTVAEWVTSSGMTVHFGMYPQGGFCLLTKAGAETLKGLPPLLQAANFWAGVTGSSLLTLLFVFLTFRSSRGSGFINRTIGALRMSFGPLAVTPIFPFMLLLRMGSKSAVVTWTIRATERFERFLKANDWRSKSAWLRFWRLAVLAAVADNAFSVVMNTTPLTQDHDGFKALYFLMMSTGWWLVFAVSVLLWQMTFFFSVALAGVQFSRVVFSYLLMSGSGKDGRGGGTNDK